MSATTDDLVADVRSLARLPDAGDPDASGILRFADAEMVTMLSALVKTARMEHWMAPNDYAGDGSTTRFRLPRRALDRAYRSVTVLDPTGNELPAYEVSAGSTYTWARSERRYYVEADTLVFLAAPSVSYTVRVRARRRSSKLVATTDCCAIDHALTTTTLAMVVTAVPTWMSAVDTKVYTDIVRGDSPYDVQYEDRILSTFSSPTLEFSSLTPIVVADFVNLTNIANDRVDYVCKRDQTCYPPLPEAAFPALVAGTAVRVLVSLGDPRSAELRAIYNERLTTALDLISPRSDEGGVPIVNDRSALRSGRGYQRGRR